MSDILLKLLEFNATSKEKTHTKLLDEIMYFLLSRIDPVGIKDVQFCWPIYDAKQSQEFKAVCLRILEKLFSQGKLKLQFKKYNYDLAKCQGNIIELCLYLIKSRLKNEEEQTIDALKESILKTIEERKVFQDGARQQVMNLNQEIDVLKDKLNARQDIQSLDDEKRRVLKEEKDSLIARLNHEFEILEMSFARIKQSNMKLTNLSSPKKVLENVELVFSEGKMISDFEGYMIKVCIEPFKDGKLDLVVFMGLYKVLLEKIYSAFQGERDNLETLGDCFPGINKELEQLLKDFKAANWDLEEKTPD